MVDLDHMTSAAKGRHRAPRYARVTPSPMRLTERDLEILRTVYRFRFASSRHIAALVGGSSQQLLRRLRALFDHGFLDRPRAQITYLADWRNAPLAYGLGRAGAAALAELGEHPSGRLEWTSKNKKAGVVFLEHTLAITGAMVGFELACRKNPRVRLMDEGQVIAKLPEARRGLDNPLHWDAEVTLASAKPKKVRIVPDRSFSLVVDEDKRANFHLEIDRGTERILPRTPRHALARNSVNRKLQAYYAGWRAKQHKETLGWQNFRVVTITTSAERVNSMIDAVKVMTGGSGSRLFLFADAPSLQGADPLKYLWRNGKDEKTTIIV